MSQRPEPSKNIREEYDLRDSDCQRMMAGRSAARQGAFLLPHLHVGMSLLDCGCGPGSITLDFARLVAPGHVLGIDIDAGEVQRASGAAQDAGIANADFRTGDIYALPFEDKTFDAAFSNAVLDHLREPQKALQELYRVLKPGGVLGVRTADRDGYLMAPADPVLEKWAQRGEDRKAAQGISVRLGKQLRRLMREAGFVRVEASASYDSYGTAEQVRAFSEAMAKRQDRDALAGDIDAASVAAAWRKWGESPDAFAAQSLCEAVGWRDK